MGNFLILLLAALGMVAVLWLVSHWAATNNSSSGVTKRYLTNPFLWVTLIVLVIVMLPFTGAVTSQFFR